MDLVLPQGLTLDTAGNVGIGSGSMPVSFGSFSQLPGVNLSGLNQPGGGLTSSGSSPVAGPPSPSSSGGGYTPPSGSSIIPSGQPGSGMTNDQYKADQLYRAQQQAQQDAYNQQISDAYQPAIDSLNDWGNQVTASLGPSGSAAQNVGTTYDQSLGTVNQEKGDLLSNLANQTTQLGTTTQSALDDAARYFNGLTQQNMSRYGMGSSTGGAVNDLANQAFLQNQGQINTQNTQGLFNIQDQTNKAQTYIADKVNTLDSWKRDTLQKIQDAFNQTMGTINSQKGVVESNKTNAKLAALQQAQQNAQNVMNTSNQYVQQLAQWGVQQAQTASNRAFSPSEIASTYAQIMNNIQQSFPQFGLQTPASSLPLAYRAGTGSSSSDQLLQQTAI